MVVEVFGRDRDRRPCGVADVGEHTIRLTGGIRAIGIRVGRKIEVRHLDACGFNRIGMRFYRGGRRYGRHGRRGHGAHDAVPAQTRERVAAATQAGAGQVEGERADGAGIQNRRQGAEGVPGLDRGEERVGVAQ
ncbi:hypothetical protein, partial [Methylobacterium sp. WL103]|uniref:hypothetical protein n=1 Tax=Methylobacterium sp. WL103 TaxID=2603891 RepID=UPI001AEDA5A6